MPCDTADPKLFDNRTGRWKRPRLYMVHGVTTTTTQRPANASQPMRHACADVFESWIAAGTERFLPLGLGEERTRELIVGLIAALEGAFVLCRALRSTQPLLVAGELVAGELERVLA